MRAGRRDLLQAAVATVVAAAVVLSVSLAPPGETQVWAQQPASPSASNYVLGPLDELDITVFGESDLSRRVTVRPDGKITLPLIGEITVAGLTTTQLAEKIAQGLRPYVKSPVVSVTVAKAREDAVKFFVYLVGEVKNPGSYQIKTGWTVMEVIAEAGGVTTKANLRKASLIRRATNQTIPLDLDRLILKGDASANVALEGGDVILVPEFLNRVLVWGTVRSPGVYDLKEGARVLDAVLAAGGPDKKAAINAVGIIRQTEDGKRTLVATVDLNKVFAKADQSQNILLQHADIIYVPQGGGVTWQDILSYLSGLGLIFSLFGF